MKINKLPSHIKVLTIITIINLLVLFIRDLILKNNIFDFLTWNLFLGFLPLFAAWIIDYFDEKLSPFLFLMGSFIWLIFYPNAPYMISDLIHVAEAPDLIHDTFIIFSFAMLSAFYGFLSLKIMHHLFEKRKGKKIANASIFTALLLSCLGFFMGRILRLNSWDIFTKPLEVIQDVFEHLWPITKNPNTYIIMFLFGGVQYMLLIMMKDVNDFNKAN